MSNDDDWWRQRLALLREDLQHVGGVPWDRAPIPGRFHRCRRQTYGVIEYVTYIERCACGAFRRTPGGWWVQRNGRKKGATIVQSQQDLLRSARHDPPSRRQLLRRRRQPVQRPELEPSVRDGG